MVGSAFQAVAISAFLLTQDEVGLFMIAAAFGFGFSGIIPAYSVAIRDLYPAAEASWRIPLVLFTAMGGMAVGSWLAGLHLRPLRLLRTGFRHRRRLQHRQPGDRRLPDPSPHPAKAAGVVAGGRLTTVIIGGRRGLPAP